MPQVSFKTKLKLNNKQATLLAKHAGTARHAWNWGLSLCLTALDNKEKLPTAIDLHQRLVAEVKSVNPWYDEVSPCSPQQALRHLATAFQRWLVSKVSQKPKFKKKGNKDSFYLEGRIKISGNRINLPQIGWVTCHEIPPSVTVKNVTISKLAQDWYISFSYEKDIQTTAKIRDRIGVDVGINRLSTCSDGTEVENVKAYQKAKGRLVRLQRTLSRKVKGSSNRQKASNRLAKQHRRVANVRADALHKLTTWLAKNHSTIVIEDLHGSGRHKNHRLASAIADCGCYEFKRQLLYKASWYGAEVIVASRFYPFSQLCSEYSHQQQMPLHIRTFSCSCCGMKKDQDFNALVNLEHYTPAVSSTVVACGDSLVTACGQWESMKQEADLNLGMSKIV
ncbi:RNA-guided endonuclease InsQ/TnpB family protein [Coleofasciculus chthonoplastes]|uniref:RNA-guided endonuclease InsQ/TnpB family protein n=1 Tax=Coleofasciculus chthonoplastes TaxID=64178 RepID=UPI0033041E80